MANSKSFYVHPSPDGNPYAERGDKGYFIQNIKICDSLSVPYTDAEGKEYDGQKFEFFIQIPVLPDECMEVLNTEAKTILGDEFDGLTCLINGIRQAYYSCDVSKDSKVQELWKAGDTEGAHRAAVECYAEFVTGRKASAGPTVKSKAKAYDAAASLAAEAEMTIEEAVRLAKLAKAQGLA